MYSIKYKDKWRKKNITYLLQGWPEHDIPKDIQSIYGNILFMFYIIDKLIGNENPPICVHSSAGYGRCGTFIVYIIYIGIFFLK